MTTKTFEIRDTGTHIPCLAIRLDTDNEADHYVIARGGFSNNPVQQAQYVILVNLATMVSHHDPYNWPHNRTLFQAHHHIIAEWDNLESGSVVCTEFLRGERETPKVSDRFYGVENS